MASERRQVTSFQCLQELVSRNVDSQFVIPIFFIILRSKHMDFNFPETKGTGLSAVLSNLSKEALTIIDMLCVYDPENR